MGKYAAKVIAARIAGKPAPKPFRYVHLGELATIGRRAAVVKLGWLKLKGFSAGCSGAWCTSIFSIGLRNRFVVAFTWLWSYLTFQRGARLITDPERGQRCSGG